MLINYVAPIFGALFAFSPLVNAEVSVPKDLYMQYGSRSEVNSYTVGATAPMGWNKKVGYTRATGYWDLSGTFYSASSTQGSTYRSWVATLAPTLRLRLAESFSRWFVEGGIGISYSDVLYQRNNRKFSTRFNFVNHLGFGASLGNSRNQEIVLRVQHVSNGGIKSPNPGENNVQLRYAYAF